MKKPKDSGGALVLDESGGFRGFGSQALPFLRTLKENNDREWFAVHKATYLDECDAPLRELVAEVGARLAARKIPLAPMVRNPVFRIYRDVRFSKNKVPYKTNISAALHPDGDKSRPGLLYIHVEPGASFLAAGFYSPDTPLLRALREAIVADASGFTTLITKLQSHGLALGDGDPLTRMPKGFEDHADSPLADPLRKRSIITTQPLTDDAVESRDLPDLVVRFALAAYPLLEFFATRVETGS